MRREWPASSKRRNASKKQFVAAAHSRSPMCTYAERGHVPRGSVQPI
jgi:hypothetical protein